MKQNTIEYELIWKKINSSLSSKDEKVLEAWLQSNYKHRAYYEKVEEFYITGKIHNYEKINISQAWLKAESRLSERKKQINYLWTKIAAAVVVLILCIVSTYMVLNIEPSEIPLSQRLNKEIPPGVSMAKLTLANGKTVMLDATDQFETIIGCAKLENKKAKLVYSSNISQEKNKLIEEIHKLDIPRGGKYFLVLQDGTKVWINSETTLKYPIVFNPEGERVVELSGEAYFEVAKDTKRPFKVKLNEQTIEVLGTEFNVSSYSDESHIYTTLVKGKVKVTNNQNPENSFCLEPGHQLSYSKESGNILNVEVDVDQYVSWKDDIYKFKAKRLEDIMITLSRWYNVNIIFENEDYKEIRFTGEINRVKNFEDILNIIEKTNEVKFKSDYEGIVIY
jgi:ferric-dicitrate binding protein FerR (iron transport regulator)